MKATYELSKLVIILIVLLSVGQATAQSQEFMMDGMTFGMPEAVVFTEDYNGPPVVGDHFTMLRNLAPLDY